MIQAPLRTKGLDSTPSVLSYTDALLEYCRTHSEESLYRASLLSGDLIGQGMGPDEIVAMHFDAVQSVAADELLTAPERIRVLNDAHQFLLEIMIGYGAQYKEFLDLRLEAAIRRAESAERSEREKLEILAMIAHELGNPLTVALGNMQMAARYLDTQDVTNVRSLVSDSREALERLASLTRQILAASQGEVSDEIPLDVVDLAGVIRMQTTWAQRIAAEKGVRLKLEADAPVKVVGNGDALASILSNLLSNAFRYTPSGGTVTASCVTDGSEGRLEVHDTGIGLTPEDQARIFEKFYRASTARQMESRGLGMGLVITSRLAAALGGRIEVESKLGSGSTFRAIFLAADEGG